MTMTAEQLEELLVNRSDPKCETCGRDDFLLETLARRVIAAEKLVDAAENLVIGIGMGWDVDEMQIILDEAATAYREASK